jgi:SMODS-associating 2TM, beta-strand rich effector domain
MNIRHEIGLWCQAVVFIGIWVLLVYVSQPELRITFGALKEIPDVVLVYTILYFLFTTWAWRWPIFAGWLIPFPDLGGTWRGTIASTWVNPETGATPPPIEAILVIRHKFDSTSCTLFTVESESQSNAAALQLEDGSDRRVLSYNYTNDPRVGVRGRSDRHTGAAILKLATQPNMRLTGEYWTSRKTTGEMDFTFESRAKAEAFSPASTA